MTRERWSVYTFRANVKDIVFAWPLADAEIAISNPLLDPQVSSREMAHSAQAFAVHDANRRCGVAAEVQPDVIEAEIREHGLEA